MGAPLTHAGLDCGLHGAGHGMDFLLGHPRPTVESTPSASEPSSGRRSGGKWLDWNRFRNPLKDHGKHGVGHAELEVFDDLHVVGRKNTADVTQIPHFPAIKAG